MNYSSVVSHTGEVVDAVGVAIIVIGTAFGLLMGGPRALKAGADRQAAYQTTRRQIGRSILLGLEILVAGDIIRTVATTPTFTSVGVLAVIVVIRTFLSWSLELEVTGRWPWQRPSQPEESP
jgi:uncharacterized membrane protein